MNPTPKTCEKHCVVPEESIKGNAITPALEREIMNDYHSPEDETILKFIEAVTSFNYHSIAELLAENGTYETMQHWIADPVEVSKNEFVAWLNGHIKDFHEDYPALEKMSCKYDCCWGCHLGGFVALFHEGGFPFYATTKAKRKFGFFIKTTDKLISDITFCNTMQHTNNDPWKWLPIRNVI